MATLLPPITHLFDFEHTNDKTRPYIMAEFAANGERNLVLTDTLIRQVMSGSGFAHVLQRNAESAGVRFVDSHVPFGSLEDLNLPFEDRRPAMLERQKLALRIIADFGVDTITCHVGNTEEAFAAYSLDHLQQGVIRSLEVLLPVAEELGITIAIENIWFPSSTPEKLLEIIHHFNSDHLGLCYDSGHANLMSRNRGVDNSNPILAWNRFGPVPYDSAILEKMLPYLTVCHLHDNNGVWDDHILPGRGDIHWPHIIRLLKTAPRLKYIQNEVIPVRTNSSVADICRTFQNLFATV